MASCSNDTPKTAVAETKVVTPATDTAGLAQYQAWKAQNELATANPQPQQNVTATTQPVKEVAKERVVYVEKPAPKKSSGTTKSAASSGSTASSGTGTGTTTTAAPVPAKKKGWSKSAKGAVIGGVGGAVAGAVINKRNRGVGAVIGGVLGAGAGYGIGKAKDKKDGRN